MVQPCPAHRIDTNFPKWKLVSSLHYLLHHIGLISNYSLTPGYYMGCLSLSSPSILSVLSLEGEVMEARVREEEESQEAGAALVPAGRALLAAQAPRNLLLHTVLKVVKCPPFPQVSCLQDVYLVEARDPKFLGIGLLSFANTYSLLIFHFQTVWKWLPRNHRKRRGWAWISIHILAPALGRGGWRWDRGLSAQHRGW